MNKALTLDRQHEVDASRLVGASAPAPHSCGAGLENDRDDRGDLAMLSLVGEFCRPLARELVGSARAKAAISYLCSAGLATVRRSKRCALFTIKPDVRERLLQRRTRQWQDDVRAHAAIWYFEAGRIDSALGLVAKISSPVALELTERNGGWALAYHSGVDKLSYLIGRDVDPLRFPRTAIGQALAILRSEGRHQPLPFERLSSTEIRAAGFDDEVVVAEAMSWIMLDRVLPDDRLAQLEHVARAYGSDANVVMAAMANVALCRAFAACGDFPRSLAAGLKALQYQWVHTRPSTLHIVHLSIGLASFRIGALADARHHFNQARECAETHRGEDSFGVRSTEIFLALVSYEEGKSAREALRHSFDAILRQDGWVHLGTAGYMTAATLAYHSGSHEQAHRLLDDAEKLAISLDMSQLRDVVRCRRDYFSILSDQSSVCSFAFNDTSFDGIWRDDWQICKLFTYSCQLIHSEAWHEAAEILEGALCSPDSELNIPMKARLLALLVAAYWRTRAPEGKIAEAVKRLKHVVVGMGYAGSIIDCRFVLEDALSAVAAARCMSSVQADAGKILTALRAAAERAARYNQVVALSERQLEVLNYLAEGLSNSQIAHRLQVAVGTISSYRRSLYRRLDVRSRAEIVRYVRARSGSKSCQSAEGRDLVSSRDRSSPAEGGADDSRIDQNLSPRQREVLRSVAEGMTNKEIARCLNLSEQTIKTYRRTLYRKLGISSRHQAVSFLRAAIGDAAPAAH